MDMDLNERYPLLIEVSNVCSQSLVNLSNIFLWKNNILKNIDIGLLLE